MTKEQVEAELIRVKLSLEEEKDHTAWLEKLLNALYGTCWKELTIHDATECVVIPLSEQ